MLKRSFLKMRILFILAFAALGIANQAFADGEVDPVWTAAESTGTFSNNFLKTVTSSNVSNLITSPFSAQIALAMLAYGAGGSTADILRSVLVLPADDQLGQEGLKTLFEAFNSTQGVDLRLANKLFTSTSIPVKDTYKQLVASVFSSSVQELDFSEGDAAAGTINTWCEEQTDGRIKDLIKPGDMTPLTALVLVNAIYFKGKWDEPFDPDLTTNMTFHVDAQTTKEVPTMLISSKFRIGIIRELHARFIEIPYKGKEMSMIIVLPIELDGLSTIVDNIDQLNLTYYLNHAFPRKVELYLPKFEIETKLELKETLEQLGLGEIFLDRANFSGIVNAPSKVTNVVQKAFIKVNEEGSEAAAATGVEVETRMGPMQFRVNRPVYYTIWHSATQTALFSGFLTNP